MRGDGRRRRRLLRSSGRAGLLALLLFGLREVLDVRVVADVLDVALLLGFCLGAPRALAITNDVYSRNDALALAEDDDVADMSARELKTLVVYGGDARHLVGVVEKSELRQLAAEAQLVLRGDKQADSDDDFEEGETLSE